MSTHRTQTVGPVTKRTNVSASTLRQWERDGLIPKPSRSTDGRRQFTEEQVTFIRNFAQQRREERRKPASSEG